MKSQRRRRTSSMRRPRRAIPSPQEGSGNEGFMGEFMICPRSEPWCLESRDNCLQNAQVIAYMTSGTENRSTEHIMNISVLFSVHNVTSTLIHAQGRTFLLQLSCPCRAGTAIRVTRVTREKGLSQDV
eukprot:1137000-Pelagomonas_calceolata.AAC.1